MRPDVKGRTSSEPLAVEILTPLHIGSGQTLHKSMDFIAKDGVPFVVDQNGLFAVLASGKADLDALLRQSDDLEVLTGVLGDDELSKFGYRLTPYGGGTGVPEQVREGLKNAFFQPYLPGSSLKGAIRTAIFSQSIMNGVDASVWKKTMPAWVDQSRRKKSEGRAGFASNKLGKAFFGASPNQDVMRALHVGEAIFSFNSLKMFDIRWLNIVKRGNLEEPQWRDISSRRNSPRPNDILGIFVEALEPGTLGSLNMQWDHFLLSDPAAWGGAGRVIREIPKDFSGLTDLLNRHALHLLSREVAFFDQFKVDGPLRACRELLSMIRSEPDAAYVRLSWGSGWNGMTGDWMDPETVTSMRELYDREMGKTGAERFPKTRRLAVKGMPSLPLGWIRLWDGDKAKSILNQQKESQSPARI